EGVLRQERGVGQRLVPQAPPPLPRGLGFGRPKNDLGMLAAEGRRDDAGEVALVVARYIETDCEGSKRQGNPVARRESGGGAGVDAAADEYADRDVAAEPAAHGRFELADEPVAPLTLTDGMVRREREAPVRHRVRLAARRHYQRVGGRELRDPAQNRVRRWN